MYVSEGRVGNVDPLGNRVGFPRTAVLASSLCHLLKYVSATRHGSIHERAPPVPVRRPLAGACARRLGGEPRSLLLPAQGAGAGSRVRAADGVDLPEQRA